MTEGQAGGASSRQGTWGRARVLWPPQQRLTLWRFVSRKLGSRCGQCWVLHLLWPLTAASAPVSTRPPPRLSRLGPQ